MLEILLLMLPDEDKAKFRAVYDEYHNLVFHISLEHLYNPEDAEDSQQEAFLYIAKNFGKIKDRSKGEIKNYICTVAHGFAISYYRKKHRIDSKFVDLDVSGYREIDDSVFDVYDIVDVQRGLEQLPTEMKNILELKLVYGLESKEIAAIYGISNDNARKKVQRGKRALMKFLVED